MIMKLATAAMLSIPAIPYIVVLYSNGLGSAVPGGASSRSRGIVTVLACRVNAAGAGGNGSVSHPRMQVRRRAATAVEASKHPRRQGHGAAVGCGCLGESCADESYTATHMEG